MLKYHHCKSCKLDPVPIHLLKANLAPVIADIVNVSVASGVFPSAFKNSVAEENNV